MPLYDHFHPPLSERRPWESFHTTWAGCLADALNDGGLPTGFIALEHVHSGPRIEIDVATFSSANSNQAEDDSGVGTSTLARAVWTPATAPLVMPATFPPSSTVEIHSTEGGRVLVAAIELVSPANKDRARSRGMFVSKCATYLSRGVGLVVVDVVTSRLGNLHNEMVEFLGVGSNYSMPDVDSLYVVAYRPLQRDGDAQIDTWPMSVSVGQPLPTVPLSLGAEQCVPVDLEAAYLDACRRRRVEEALSRS